jgi:gluconate 2-dehydrogenase gamma chain
MTRRELLANATMLVGYSLTASLASAVMSGCRPTPGLAFKPQFLTAGQASFVSAFAERLLPKTDTPGAGEAGVPGYIDQVVGLFKKPEERKQFEDALLAFSQKVEADHGGPFDTLAPDLQDKAITELAKTPKVKEDDYSLFRDMKGMAITGYVTSELGATKLLNSVPIPGRYEGCITLEKAGGKQFAPN